MYDAKQRGKGRWARFERSMHTAILRRHGLKEQLQQAVARKEFAVEYQPIARLADGDVVAAEALVRWRHPERGVVAPGEFIPLAEETGLIVPIGEFVLDEACRRAAGRDIGMHVNLSAVELQHVDVLERVTSTLRRHRVPPEQLTLEITESVLVDAQMSATLRELHELGVRLALDDFGTGYSSLSYLRSFPLDVLKIAKPFVDGRHGPPRGALVRAHDRRARAHARARGRRRGHRVRGRSSTRCARWAATSARASICRRRCRPRASRSGSGSNARPGALSVLRDPDDRPGESCSS